MKLARIALLAVGFFALKSQAMILPPNHLDRFDHMGFLENITEQQFNEISDKITALYAPIAAKRSAVLTVNKNWTDSTVNAYAQETGTDWNVNMYGGLARRPEVSLDGFAMVVCHELGHHFGGYYFYEDSDWAAGEGEADYFATQVCAKRVFTEVFPGTVDVSTVPTFAKGKCDLAWTSASDRNICYRTAIAGQSLAGLLAALAADGSGSPAVVLQFDTPDASQVTVTNTAHPQAQCRMDTYFQGALCNMTQAQDVIPGRDMATDAKNSVDAEKLAGQNSCLTSMGHGLGFRPLCWFHPQM